MIGRVYKIIHLDSSLSYIGSTCDTLPGRWRRHKDTYKQWISDKNKYRSVALFPFIEQYGFDRFKMILVKEYQVADKLQLFAYEQLAINRTKLICNQNASLQLVGTSSMSRHYYQANKDTINKRSKDHYQANKQAFRDRYQANKDTILQVAATKMPCECGSIVRKDKLTGHRKTAKHARLLAALNTSQ